MKHALIVANTEYSDPNLAHLFAPGKDADDFAQTLRDPELGAFDEVKVLLNHPESFVREAIDEFFDAKRPDDLLLLYFSGHGIRDENGALYLAFKNTSRARLRATALRSDFIREGMDQTRSRRVVLILDCCNSGAFAQGSKTILGASVGTASAFEGTGYGRVVLTASDSTQFAWEGDRIIGGETNNSLFTHFLIEGLKGEADLNSDGKITVDELYDYAYEQIVQRTPKQTPGKWSYKQQGEIVLTRNLRVENIKPVALPEELAQAVDDTRPFVREGAVQQLEKILKGKNIGMARTAREALEKMAKEDDSRKVMQAATLALRTVITDKLKAKREDEAWEKMRDDVKIQDAKEKIEPSPAPSPNKQIPSPVKQATKQDKDPEKESQPADVKPIPREDTQPIRLQKKKIEAEAIHVARPSPVRETRTAPRSSSSWVIAFFGIAFGFCLLAVFGIWISSVVQDQKRHATETARVSWTQIRQTKNAHLTETAEAYALEAQQTQNAMATDAYLAQAAQATNAAKAYSTSINKTLNVQATLAQSNFIFGLTPYGIAEQFPSILYYDPFEQEGEWSLGDVTNDYWTGKQAISSYYTWTVNGVYKTFVSWETIPNIEALTDFYVQVDVKLIYGSSDACYGLTFRGATINNLYSYYLFTVCDNNRFRVDLRMDGAWITIADWQGTNSVHAGEVNRLGVSALGNQFEVFINDRAEYSFQNDSLSSGYLKIALNKYDTEPSEHQFDNLIILTP